MVSSRAARRRDSDTRRRRRRSTASATATSQIHQGALTQFGQGTTKGAMKGRLYHETAMSTTSPRVAADHVAGHARTPIRQWFARRDGARVRADVAGRRARAGARPAGRVHPARRRRRERADRARAATDRSRAFHNVCRHRGTRLCTEEHGRFQGSIQCPYHAWTYGLDGRLLAAPQMDEVDGFDRSAYPLRRVACETWDGHIFINLADSPGAAAAQLGGSAGAVRVVARCRSCGSRTGSSTTSRPTGSWWSRTTTSACTARSFIRCSTGCTTTSAADNVPTTEHLLRRRDGLQGRRRDAEHRRQAAARRSCRASASASATLVNYFAIYPNLLLTLHPDYMMTITIWPQDCGRTKLDRRMAFPSRRDGEAGFRVRGRGRFLGSHQSRRLGDLRAVVSRHQLTRLSSPGRTRSARSSCGSSISSLLSRTGHGSTETRS